MGGHRRSPRPARRERRGGINGQRTEAWCRDFYLGRLIFLAGNRDEPRKHFQVRLLEESDTDVVLGLDRKPDSAGLPYRSVRLTLPRKTYLPIVIEVDDLLGRTTTVRHELRDIRVNTPAAFAENIEAPDFGDFKWLAVPNAVDVAP